MKDKVYHLKAGDGFFIPPNTDNNYYPIVENPWVYRWVGINGSKAKEMLKLCGFDNENYIFNYTKDDKINFYLKNIYESCSKNHLFDATGNLYQFLSLLMVEYSNSNLEYSSHSDNYITKSIEYIEKNYQKNISVSDVSSYLNIDRSYFYKVFKSSMMITPQQYIIDYKLKKSCDLIRKSSYSINEISSLVGFSSQSYFSKLFKKNIGITPIEYKRQFIKS